LDGNWGWGSALTLWIADNERSAAGPDFNTLPTFMARQRGTLFGILSVFTIFPHIVAFLLPFFYGLPAKMHFAFHFNSKRLNFFFDPASGNPKKGSHTCLGQLLWLEALLVREMLINAQWRSRLIAHKN